MAYKKVFSSTRFRTGAQNNFNLSHKDKRVLVGSREPAPSKSAYIGKVIEQGRTGNLLDYEVHCDISFPHVIGVFGSRGSGKSFDLGVFLEEIFQSGQGGDSGIVFDIQDQFWTLAHVPSQDISGDTGHLADLAKWGLAPAALPHLVVWLPRGSDTPVPDAKPFSLAPIQLSDADWLALLELERFSPMGQALLNLLRQAGPLTPDLLAQAIPGSGLTVRFQQPTLDGLSWRLNSLADVGIIDNSGVEIDDLLQPDTLSVILMRNLSDGIRGLVVGVVARLVADRMGREKQRRKVAMRTGQDGANTTLASRLWMVLDEAHVLVPSDGSTAATEPMIDYVKRGRDAGLSLIFATQQPSAVNTKMISQVDLTITHSLAFETDLAAAAARMPARVANEYEVDNEKTGAIGDVLRSLSPGEAIVADTSSGRAFLIKIRPRLSAHGGVSPV